MELNISSKINLLQKDKCYMFFFKCIGVRWAAMRPERGLNEWWGTEGGAWDTCDMKARAGARGREESTQRELRVKGRDIEGQRVVTQV